MMAKVSVTVALLVFVVVLSAGTGWHDGPSLRDWYSRNPAKWPRAWVDSGARWRELASIPYDSAYAELSEQPKVLLGKLLFFDPRLSGSNQISCSSCHDPEMAWTDGRSVALGHDHQQGIRNTLSLLNVAERKDFFWDGRATTLEEQAAQPIAAHDEMAMDTRHLAKKLNGMAGYRGYFEAAFGNPRISYGQVLEALAAFQRTLRSRRSRFDEFVEGDYHQLTDQEIKGLHLFRTKARCINCHNGPYFTDDLFHNIGLTYYKRELEDLGRYRVTGKPEDVGRFRTPSLRDVMHTGPWMHNGLFDDMLGVVSMYNSGMHMLDPTAAELAADPLYPHTDPLLKPLNLTVEEADAIAAFMEAITATSYKMERPNELYSPE